MPQTPRTFPVQISRELRVPLERATATYGKFSKVVGAAVLHFLGLDPAEQTQIIQRAANNGGETTKRLRTGARQR